MFTDKSRYAYLVRTRTRAARAGAIAMIALTVLIFLVPVVISVLMYADTGVAPNPLMLGALASCLLLTLALVYFGPRRLRLVFMLGMFPLFALWFIVTVANPSAELSDLAVSAFMGPWVMVPPMFAMTLMSVKAWRDGWCLGVGDDGVCLNISSGYVFVPWELTSDISVTQGVPTIKISLTPGAAEHLVHSDFSKRQLRRIARSGLAVYPPKTQNPGEEIFGALHHFRNLRLHAAGAGAAAPNTRS